MFYDYTLDKYAAELVEAEPLPDSYARALHEEASSTLTRVRESWSKLPTMEPSARAAALDGGMDELGRGRALLYALALYKRFREAGII